MFQKKSQRIISSVQQTFLWAHAWSECTCTDNISHLQADCDMQMIEMDVQLDVDQMDVDHSTFVLQQRQASGF